MKGAFAACLQDGFSAFRERVNATGLNSALYVPFFMMAAAVFTTSLGFFFGRPVSGSVFWIACGAAIAFAAVRSWRNAAVAVSLMGAAGFVTVYSFTYTRWDVLACHWPMAQAMLEGWNPVLEATVDAIRRATGGGAKVEHILLAPKFPAVCAALVCAATNLFTAGMFANICMLYALIGVAFRFATRILNANRYSSCVFAILMAVLPVEILQWAVSGHVDYFKYAAILGGVFAFGLYCRDDCSNAVRWGWAILSACFVSVGVVSKIAVIAYFAIVVPGLLLARSGWRHKAARRIVLAAVVFVSVCGASPYLTQWIHSGSPFYPAHSFLPNAETHSLTDDFVQKHNGDVQRMDRLSRISYAWFAPEATLKCCRRIYGESFSPDLEKDPVLNGHGGDFCFLMCMALLLLPLVKDGYVALSVVAMFVLGNISIKYIGFLRYFPEIGAVPFLVFWGFAFKPRFLRGRLQNAVKAVVLAFSAYFVVLASITLAGQTSYNITAERIRQNLYDEIRSHAVNGCVRLPPGKYKFESFALARRIEAAGLGIDDENGTPIYFPSFGYPQTFGMPVGISREKASDALRAFPKRWFGIMKYLKPREFWRCIRNFDWFAGFPKPLFQPR